MAVFAKIPRRKGPGAVGGLNALLRGFLQGRTLRDEKEQRDLRNALRLRELERVEGTAKVAEQRRREKIVETGRTENKKFADDLKKKAEARGDFKIRPPELPKSGLTPTQVGSLRGKQITPKDLKEKTESKEAAEDVARDLAKGVTRSATASVIRSGLAALLEEGERILDPNDPRVLGAAVDAIRRERGVAASRLPDIRKVTAETLANSPEFFFPLPADATDEERQKHKIDITRFVQNLSLPFDLLSPSGTAVDEGIINKDATSVADKLVDEFQKLDEQLDDGGQ